MQINPSNPFPFNIEIAGNSFYIHETTPEDAESTLTTLNKIELLLRDHLNYDPDLSNSIPVSKDDVYEVLRQKAKEIGNSYKEEQSKRNMFARFFFSEEKSVNNTLARIENLNAPIFPLLYKDLPPKILEKMEINELSLISRVNRQGNELGQEAIKSELKKIGYEGTLKDEKMVFDYEEAKAYLKELKSELEELKTLGFDDDFFLMDDMESSETFKAILYNGYVGDQEHFDYILGKLKNLSNKKLINLCNNPEFYLGSDPESGRIGFDKFRKFLSLNFDLKAPLDIVDKKKQARALCQAVLLEDKDILKLLLRLGVAPDSKYEGKTALDYAKETENEDCIEILKEALKN